jgi:hypothetical protein
MKKMQEDARKKRLQEYGPDIEPEFSEKLQGLHDSMMAKIQEIDDAEDTKDEEVPPGEPISSENVHLNAEEYEDAPSVRPRAHLSTTGISISEPLESKSIPKIQEIEDEPVESESMIAAAKDTKTLETVSQSMVTLVEEVEISSSVKEGSGSSNDDLLQEQYEEKSRDEAAIPLKNPKGKSTVKATRELLEKIQTDNSE